MTVGVVRFLVADRSGKIIADLAPEVGPVSERLNDIGVVKFSLARGDASATETNLRYGNRVLIQFDNGLPDWAGVIGPPQTWDGHRIQCSAYSGEHMLGFRQTDRGRYFSGASVGAIFAAVISEASDNEPLGIEIGSVWTGGELHSPEYHYESLLAIIRDSICGKLSTADFDVSGQEIAGKIVFTANLYQRKGISRANIALMEGHNISAAKLNEQGPIVNWIDLAGQGNGWGDDRLVSNVADATSRTVYGLRQASAVYSDVVLQGTLDAHAANLLAESKDPHRLIELEAVDVRDPGTDAALPGGFGSYGVGDSVRVILPSYGFGGTDVMVRILAREYSQGKCKLVVRTE